MSSIEPDHNSMARSMAHRIPRINALKRIPNRRVAWQEGPEGRRPKSLCEFDVAKERVRAREKMPGHGRICAQRMLRASNGKPGRSAGVRGASDAPPDPIGPRARVLGVKIVQEAKPCAVRALSRYVVVGYGALAGAAWIALHGAQATARKASYCRRWTYAGAKGYCFMRNSY